LVTHAQIKAIKARQEQNIRRLKDFGLPSERLFPKPKPRLRFNLQEEKILERLKKRR